MTPAIEAAAWTALAPLAVAAVWTLYFTAEGVSLRRVWVVLVLANPSATEGRDTADMGDAFEGEGEREA